MDGILMACDEVCEKKSGRRRNGGNMVVKQGGDGSIFKKEICTHGDLSVQY